MKVPFNDLKRIHDPLRKSFHEDLDTIIDSSAYVGDSKFAEDFKVYTGSKNCVTCNSGTDALYLAIKALELRPNTKIIVPAVSYEATSMAVKNAGHIPIFVDVNRETALIDVHEIRKCVTLDPEIKCIIVVHLYGQRVDMEHILKCEFGLPIIEDCAQAHGLKFNDGRHVGTMGTIGCFSFYPGKNLGALGDGGACITDNAELAVKMKQYASLGAPLTNRYEHETDGINSRMDGIQGMFLSRKIKLLDDWTEERRKIATVYKNGMISKAIPYERWLNNKMDVFHVFYILMDDRDNYIKFMNDNGIQTGIHYPTSLPELKCNEKYYRECPNAKEFCSKCVSLPMFPYMTDDEINNVMTTHNRYIR